MSKAGASLATCYGPVSADVITRAENIRLLILDVDGVLSDGLIYMGNNGEELKAFNVRDGYGIRCALTSGIEVGSPTCIRGSQTNWLPLAISLANWRSRRRMSPTLAMI